MNFDVTKAWKDAQYRETLTSEELAQLPQNPIGTIELTDTDLSAVNGACGFNSHLHQNHYHGYQFHGGHQCGGHQQHHQYRQHHHSGGNWFGGYQHSSGGSNWFGGHHGDCH